MPQRALALLVGAAIFSRQAKGSSSTLPGNALSKLAEECGLVLFGTDIVDTWYVNRPVGNWEVG